MYRPTVASICHRTLYRNMLRNVAIYDRRPPELHHNPYRMHKLDEMSSRTFVGDMSCGVLCYCLAPVLHKYGFRDIKLMYTRQNSGRHLEDHVFLVVDGLWWIDPSWRQFYRVVNETTPRLEELVYDMRPPILIGTRDQFLDTVSTAILRADIRSQAEIRSIYRNWQNSKEHTKMLDMTAFDDVD